MQRQKEKQRWRRGRGAGEDKLLSPLMGECASGTVKLSQCQQEGRKKKEGSVGGAKCELQGGGVVGGSGSERRCLQPER